MKTPQEISEEIIVEHVGEYVPKFHDRLKHKIVQAIEAERKEYEKLKEIYLRENVRLNEVAKLALESETELAESELERVRLEKALAKIHRIRSISMSGSQPSNGDWGDMHFRLMKKITEITDEMDQALSNPKPNQVRDEILAVKKQVYREIISLLGGIFSAEATRGKQSEGYFECLSDIERAVNKLLEKYDIINKGF